MLYTNDAKFKYWAVLKFTMTSNLISDGDDPIGQPKGHVHTIVGPSTATYPAGALQVTDLDKVPKQQ